MVTWQKYTVLIRNLSHRRLEPYDRNFDFKPDPFILPQSVPTKCWISATFGDHAQGNPSKDVNGADWGLLYLQTGR